jgi:hypothetical protein
MQDKFTPEQININLIDFTVGTMYFDPNISDIIDIKNATDRSEMIKELKDLIDCNINFI